MPDMTGWTKRQRAERRQMYLDQELATARWTAHQRERSLKCAGGAGNSFYPVRHAGDPNDGCRNDGSTCICECHDPEVER